MFRRGGRALRRCLAAGAGGAATAAGAYVYSGHVCHAKVSGSAPLGRPAEGDTGQALQALPAHLQNIQRRFKYYADSTDGSSGAPMMSASAFLRSVLGAEKGEAISPQAVEGLAQRFNLWESVNKGLLTYDAYSTYQLMLRCSEGDAGSLFIMYDDNESETLNIAQFQDLMTNMAVHADKTAQIDCTSGYALKRFGKMHDKEMDQQTWKDDLTALKGDVWLSSFAHFDKNNTGTVTAQEFIGMALESVGVTGIGAKNRIQKSILPPEKETLQLPDAYDASFWVAFNRVINHRWQIEDIMTVSRSRFPIGPQEFYDIMRSCKLKINREQSDIIFAIFDRNADRDLSYNEVLSTMTLFRRSDSLATSSR